MTIQELQDQDREDWDHFVRHHTDGTFFHLSQWKTIIERSFRCRTLYLYKKEAGVITGILPLALVKRPVFGPALVSVPLAVYGGGIGDSHDLEQAAIRKAEELGVMYLELRTAQQSTSLNGPTNHCFYRFRRSLSGEHEENFKAIPRKQRAEVRKGIAANLEVVVNHDIDLFYKIYAISVHNLGTPVFPKKYLHQLINILHENCHITTVFHNDHPLTSVLSFKYKDQILPYYGGGLPMARHHSAYPYMYWKVMERAVDEGVRLFDFGRSMQGSGAYAFKKNFGFEPTPLLYQYHLVRAQDMPDMAPDTPRNKLITSLWKKIPHPVANRIGPVLYPAIM